MRCPTHATHDLASSRDSHYVSKAPRCIRGLLPATPNTGQPPDSLRQPLRSQITISAAPCRRVLLLAFARRTDSKQVRSAVEVSQQDANQHRHREKWSANMSVVCLDLWHSNTSQMGLQRDNTHIRKWPHGFSLPTLPQNLVGTEHEKKKTRDRQQTPSSVQRQNATAKHVVWQTKASPPQREFLCCLAISNGERWLLRWPSQLIAFAAKMACEWNKLRCTSQQASPQHFLRVCGFLAVLSNLIRRTWSIRSFAQQTMTLCIRKLFSSPRVLRCPRWNLGIFEDAMLPLLSHNVTLSRCSPLHRAFAPITVAFNVAICECVDSF